MLDSLFIVFSCYIFSSIKAFFFFCFSFSIYFLLGIFIIGNYALQSWLCHLWIVGQFVSLPCSAHIWRQGQKWQIVKNNTFSLVSSHIWEDWDNGGSHGLILLSLLATSLINQTKEIPSFSSISLSLVSRL
jgi:hypothetical protein